MEKEKREEREREREREQKSKLLHQSRLFQYLSGAIHPPSVCLQVGRLRVRAAIHPPSVCLQAGRLRVRAYIIRSSRSKTPLSSPALPQDYPTQGCLVSVICGPGGSE
jgi:hypothetical protein